MIDSAEKHWKIGVYLVKYGFVTQEQLERALDEQHAQRDVLRPPPMIGHMLVAHGWITPHGLATALMLQQQDALSGPHPRAPQRLGELLVAEGYMSVEQMATALAKHIDLQQRDVQMRLGDLVIRERYVDSAVIEQLLIRQIEQQSLCNAA